MNRMARVERLTHETQIMVELDLDGIGVVEVGTGVPFFDHMLSSNRNGGSTMSMPSGAPATPASLSSDLISVTASRMRPASGATAPRKPRNPGRQFSSGSHVEYSL